MVRFTTRIRPYDPELLELTMQYRPWCVPAEIYALDQGMLTLRFLLGAFSNSQRMSTGSLGFPPTPNGRFSITVYDFGDVPNTAARITASRGRNSPWWEWKSLEVVMRAPDAYIRGDALSAALQEFFRESFGIPEHIGKIYGMPISHRP